MNNDLTKDEKDEIRRNIPLGRLGTVEDIANIVYTLTQNTYITGEIIKVDGGWM